ncbi:MAG: hypothetical protein ACO1TE_15690 [Prosthecobacter sp.]
MTLHRLIGNQWVRLDRITDAAHCLRLEDFRRCEVVLDDFERSFPQAFFAAYLGILPLEVNVCELGFWLLNQGAFNTPLVSRRNDYGIVLAIDPSTQTLALSFGYAIEGYFDSKTTQKLLAEVGGRLAAGAIGKAIETACRRSGEILRRRARSVQWRPETSPDGNPIAHMGLTPLRSGHRPARAETTPSTPLR